MYTIAGLLALILVAAPGWGQVGMCCPSGNPDQANTGAPVSNSVIDLDGVVGEVHISPGSGMPYLQVLRGGDLTRVYLGPLRYLIAENFSPKTGDRVTVRGWKRGDHVIATQIVLVDQKQTLKLRDEKGWPLWRGGPWRGGKGRMSGGR